MSKEKLGTAVSLLSGSSFATLAIFAKFAYEGGANVITVLFLRFVGAAIVFWLYCFLRKLQYGYGRVTIIRLMLLGALGYGSMSAFFLSAVSRIPASLAGILLYLYPALVTAATALLKQDSFNRQKGVALVVTFTGMVLVLGTSFETLDLVGILFGVGAACVYTVYIVAGSRVLQPLDPLVATTYIMTGAALACGLCGLFTGSFSFVFDYFTWVMIGGIILISTILAVSCFWLGVRWIGPSKASIISTVEPLATVLLAWIVFMEVLTLQQLLGGALIMLGVFILQYPMSKDFATDSC